MAFNHLEETDGNTERRLLIDEFIDECLDRLDSIEPLLVQLEDSASFDGMVEQDILDSLFRLFHSLKGTSAFLELPVFSDVTHMAETLLDRFRLGNLRLTSSHIDVLILTCDFIRASLRIIEKNYSDAECDLPAIDVKDRLNNLINEFTSAHDLICITKCTYEDRKNVPIAENNSAIVGSVESQTASSTAHQGKNGDGYSFNDLKSIINRLISVPSDIELFSHLQRELDSFRKQASAIDHHDFEKLTCNLVILLKNVLNQPDTDKLEVLDFVSQVVELIEDAWNEAVTENRKPHITALSGLHDLCEELIQKYDITQSAITEIIPDENSDSTPAGQTTEATFDHRIEYKRSGVDRRMANSLDINHNTLRVDVNKLNMLLDAVGELVIAESMVAQNPDIKALGDTLENFHLSMTQLSKITRNVQDIVSSIRMTPVTDTFRRMIRLVRDMASKAGKHINFTIVGEDAEVDKTVIEHIHDPIVHALRNAIDHGIENPEERRRLNKPEVGQITLEAIYNGAEVWISVTDDGRGLDRAKIVAKAVEAGILPQDDTKLTDEEVWRILFTPGFTTMDSVTALSGRGVGMDVIKNNIDGIQGKIAINSTPGKGSKIIFRLPMNLATIDGMIVMTNTDQFVVPISSVREVIHTRSENLFRIMDRRLYLKVREQVLPLIQIEPHGSVHPPAPIQSDTEHSKDEALLVVVEHSGLRACLQVDDIIGRQQVVTKAVPEYFGRIPGISGCTILGTGNVCLILDIAHLLSEVQPVTDTLKINSLLFN